MPLRDVQKEGCHVVNSVIYGVSDYLMVVYSLARSVLTYADFIVLNDCVFSNPCGAVVHEMDLIFIDRVSEG